MLPFVVRRARAQRRLLAAVVVLVTAATTLLGVCALLLGPTQDGAFRAGVQQLGPADVDVTAYVVDLAGADLESSRDDAATLVREVLAPLQPSLTSTATSRMRRLPDPEGLGYLATGDLDDEAELVDGRWPAGAPEAALPAAAAERLGLSLGDEVTLGAETGLGGADQPVTVRVVGTFRTTDPASWAGDPLSGAGFDPAYSDGSVTAPAYGPFVVDDATFLGSGSNVTGLRVTGHPSLPDADDDALSAAAAELTDGSALLSARIGDRARITRLASQLPSTLTRLHAQVDTTRSTVLVVLLLGTALALAALLLAGHLVAGLRDDERALLVSLGLSPGQQLTTAVVESLLVALVAVVVAVPAAALVHARLTHLPAMAAAGLTRSPTITAGLVLTVLVGAVLLASALVVPALGRGQETRARSRRRAVAATSLDVLLVAAAVVAWWQLDAQPATAESTGDLLLTLAPVVCLAAVATVVVRRVPRLLALVARTGGRGRSLVLPLAAAQAARRPHPGVALVLLATAVAAATFAVGLQATWQRSQRDQADLRVGTDLSLTLPGPATAADARAVAAAVPEGVASPVAVSALALGRFVGAAGSPPVLVALESTESGALLRGRLDDRSWADIGAELAPRTAAAGTPWPDGAAVDLSGRAPAGTTLTVTPTVVVQDDAGFRTDASAVPVPLDGARHRLRWLSPPGAGRLVAVRLTVSGPPTDTPVQAAASLSLTLRVAGAGTDGEAWRVAPLGQFTPVRRATVEESGSGGDAVLRTTARVDLTYLAYSDAVLLATSFDPPTEVPVVVSQRLVDATGTKVGGRLSATVGGVALPLRVVAVVPTVPSQPGRAAVLADVDTLSRALVGAGHLDPVVDGWWIADPAPATQEALRHLGTVATRAEVTGQLTHGPLRVTTPTALVLLTGAGVVLLLAGAVLVLGADQRRRATEVARLRALGLTRSEARRLLLTEHALLLAPLVLAGALVGAAATWALGPLLVRSDLGAAPVPRAVVVWPWLAELLLVGGLFALAAGAAALAAALQVRRADPALLRTDEW